MDLEPNHHPAPGPPVVPAVPVPAPTSCQRGAAAMAGGAHVVPQHRPVLQASFIPQAGGGEQVLLSSSETSFSQARGFSVPADECVDYKHVMYLEKCCSIYQ